jgi:hypothetical protein
MAWVGIPWTGRAWRVIPWVGSAWTAIPWCTIWGCSEHSHPARPQPSRPGEAANRRQTKGYGTPQRALEPS